MSGGLQKVFEPKAGCNRVKLDAGVDDLDAGQDRIEELGGVLVESHEVGGFEWRVMADPEGNEFCITAINQ
jgi:predicted enzyme related to lactoylglutathione lyase